MASVWKNRGSIDLVTAKPSTSSTEIIPDDDSCDICCGEDGACDVYFSPCGHRACASCVQRMRIANIYKADKGVRCPFCRQVIELYLNSPPPSPSADSQLPREAASFTLLLSGLDTGPRAVTEIKKPYGRGGIISIGGGNDYIPPKGVTGSDGGGLRSSTRMDELLPGYIVPPLKDTDDIVSMAMDRTGARHLDFMLREGYVKRHKVAKLCREMLTPYAAKLAVHASGNYVLQRMLEYASTHRGEGSNAECFFTAIVRSFCQEKGLVTAAQDHRGTFSVQKMLVSLKGAEEATLVAECIQGSVVTLVLDQYGVYVLERLVEALITSMNAAQGKKPRVPPKVAFKILAQICKEIQADTKALSSVAKHQVNIDATISLCGVSGIMLVECIRWALPQEEAMAAAMALAHMSNELAGSKLANRTLQGVLSLEVKDVAEQLIKGLQGRYVELATDTVNFGFKLVRACLASPCVGESTRQLIVDELLYAVLHPAGHISLLDISSGCDALAFGLCLLTQRVLDERLDTLVMVLERDKFLHFRDGMENLRKLFFVGPPLPSSSQGNSETRSSTLASVMRARSHDPSSVEMALDPSFGSRKGVSDPWSEESPSGSTFRLEKPSTQAASLPLSQPTLPRLHVSPLELPSAANLAGQSERHSTHTNATSSGGSTDHSGSSVGVGVYTPPHLRGISSPSFLPSNYSSTSVSSLSMQLGGISVSSEPIPSQPISGRIASKPGSYAPPHINPTLSAVSAPAGFSDPRFGTGASSSGSFENEHGNGDFQQISSGDGGQSSVPLPTAELSRGGSFSIQEKMDVKMSKFQEGQEVGKATGGHRQSGVCAVCNQDAANTVLLDCSHMCCCTTCSRSISVCPICSNHVTGVIDIQPVGPPPLNMLPSPRAMSTSPSLDLWDMPRLSNSNRSVDSSSFLAQSKEGVSHPSLGLSQFQGSLSGIDTNPNIMGSYTTTVGGRANSPFERLSLEEQYPASVGTSRAGAATASSIPLTHTTTLHVTGSQAISSLQQGSYRIGSRGMSSQITEPYGTGSVAVGSTSTMPSMSSSAMLPHYLPSDFYLPGKYSGTTGYSIAPVISSVGSSVPPTVAHKMVSLSPSPSFPPQQQVSVSHFLPPHRPPAPYRPPGLYRPPDLFSQKGSPAVVSQADIMAMQSIQAGNIARVVPSQWRTY